MFYLHWNIAGLSAPFYHVFCKWVKKEKRVGHCADLWTCWLSKCSHEIIFKKCFECWICSTSNMWINQKAFVGFWKQNEIKTAVSKVCALNYNFNSVLHSQLLNKHWRSPLDIEKKRRRETWLDHSLRRRRRGLAWAPHPPVLHQSSTSSFSERYKKLVCVLLSRVGAPGQCEQRHSVINFTSARKTKALQNTPKMAPVGSKKVNSAFRLLFI